MQSDSVDSFSWFYLS